MPPAHRTQLLALLLKLEKVEKTPATAITLLPLLARSTFEFCVDLGPDTDPYGPEQPLRTILYNLYYRWRSISVYWLRQGPESVQAHVPALILDFDRLFEGQAAFLQLGGKHGVFSISRGLPPGAIPALNMGLDDDLRNPPLASLLGRPLCPHPHEPPPHRPPTQLYRGTPAAQEPC